MNATLSEMQHMRVNANFRLHHIGRESTDVTSIAVFPSGNCAIAGRGGFDAAPLAEWLRQQRGLTRQIQP